MQIIWDWNGTLLDDAALAVRVTNEVFSRYGYQTIDLAAYRACFRFPVSDYYLDRGVPQSMFPEVGKAWSDAYVQAFPGTPLRPDAALVTRRFREAGLSQIILSATKAELLHAQVGAYPELENVFDQVLGIDNVYATSKVHIGLDYMEKAALDPSQTVMIGDSCHDAEVASALHCRCLLIEGGHQDLPRLLTASVPVLRSLSEAADLLLQELEARA